LLVKYEGERLRISVKPRRFIYVKLKYGGYQKRFIEEWKAGRLRVGEVLINKTKVLVPFRKDVDLTNPKGWIAIDVNESNVTCVSTNPHIIRFEHDLREIRSSYFEKRRKIQKLSKLKPTASKRLMKKYSKRKRNRTESLCHKIAKMIVSRARKHGFGIVMENLKGMRKQIRYGKRMNRRLHTLPYRRLQSYIEYKAKLAGLPVVYVNPRGTSSLCPICGGKLASNGHRLLKCRKCGCEKDRDVVACLNLLERNPRCGEFPFPPKATHEALSAEVERIVIKC